MAGGLEKLDKMSKLFNAIGEVLAGEEAVLPGTPAPARPAEPHCRPPTMPPNPEWRWLSPTEEQIVAVVGDCPLSAEEIAERSKMKCNSDFRVILRNMVARRILNSSTDGYTIHHPPAGGSAS